MDLVKFGIIGLFSHLSAMKGRHIILDEFKEIVKKESIKSILEGLLPVI